MFPTFCIAILHQVFASLQNFLLFDNLPDPQGQSWEHDPFLMSIFAKIISQIILRVRYTLKFTIKNKFHETQLKLFDEQRDKSSDKQPHTKKDKDKLIKKYTQHLIFIFHLTFTLICVLSHPTSRGLPLGVTHKSLGGTIRKVSLKLSRKVELFFAISHPK